MTIDIRSHGRALRVFLLLASFMAVSASAQNFDTMGISSVVGFANGKLQRGDYAGAIAPLEEIISRLDKITDPQKIEILQNARFQLARVYFKTGDIKSGMPLLEQYLEQEPRKQERMAMRMMAQGLFDSGDWEQIKKVSSRLLTMPDLTKDDRLNANLMLGQALFQDGEWSACVKPLTYAAENSKDEKTRQVVQVMIVRALVEAAETAEAEGEAPKWGELFGWIPRVYRTDAKYDITLNLAMMQAGKARFKQDDSLNALILYRMVLPREELIEFSEGRIAKLLEEKRLVGEKKVSTREYESNEITKQIDALRKLIDQLTELPAYEDEVSFRIGKIYHELKRYWEGYVLFDMLYGKEPDGDIGAASIMELVVTLYDLDEIDQAEKRILKYLDERIKGKAARTLLTLMMRDNLVKENGDKVVGLRKYVDRLPATTDSDELLIGANLHYMLAFGYFQQREFATAGEQFGVIIDGYPDSPILSDSYYYRGMTQMMQAKYQEAIDDFVIYQERYPDGVFYPDASFRQGVCLFGLSKTPEAEVQFTKFIDSYPTSTFVSEAYSMRGDIIAAKELEDDPDTDIDESATLDLALKDYRKAIEKSTTPKQASYAAFQAAAVYKLEFKWEEINGLMDYYMEFKGAEADVAEAVFWKGRAQIAMKQVDMAVAAYVDAIMKFGDDVGQEGVDKIVRELVTIANQRLDDDARDSLAIKLRLKQAALEPSAKTLALRVQIARALLEGEEAVSTLGTKMLASEPDFEVVPPIGLALMCDAAVAAGDTDKMGQLFDYFIEHFEESENLWSAYRAKAHQLVAVDKLQAALEIILEAQEIYGADTFMGWAYTMEGDIQIKTKQYKKAEDAFGAIKGVASWRGPLYAQADFGMGRARLAAEDFEGAHTFFQRTYLLYRGYDGGKWAADGYMAAADCLLKLGREADAVKTWQKMLEDEYVNTLPQAATAKKLIKKHGGA